MSNPYSAPQMPSQMAQLPPGFGPQPQAPMVFGILNIVFGLFGFCVGGFGVVSLVLIVSNALPGVRNSGGMEVMGGGTYITLTVILQAIGVIFAGVLIASGIFLVMYKRQGRTLAIAWAFTKLALIVLNLALTIGFVWLRVGMAPTNIVGMVGGILSVIIGLVYPALLLYFMSQPRVIAALK